LQWKGGSFEAAMRDPKMQRMMSEMAAQMEASPALFEAANRPGQGGRLGEVLRETGYESLVKAAFAGDLVAVRALVAAGADVANGDSSGYTPAYCAAQNGHLEVRAAAWCHYHYRSLNPGRSQVLQYLDGEGADLDQAPVNEFTIRALDGTSPVHVAGTLRRRRAVAVAAAAAAAARHSHLAVPSPSPPPSPPPPAIPT